MGSSRFVEIQTRPMEVLELTGLTVDAFQCVVPPCEAAIQAPMAAGGLDGPPRTARRSTTYQHCPRPTPADRLWCILVDLQTYPRHVGPGRRFGRPRARPIRGCLACQASCRRRGADGVTAADARTLVVPVLGPPSPSAPPAAAPAPASPLWA
jgi:hypothetical protein